MGRRTTGINIEHQGRVYAVIVDDTGRFVASVDGDPFYAETLKGLRHTVLMHLKRGMKPLRLPAYTEPGRYTDDALDAMVPVVITGVHGGTGNVLYRRAGDKSSTQESYSTHFYKFTATEAEHINMLRRKQKVLKDGIEQFMLKHKINAKQLVVEALTKQGDTAADIDTED